MWDQSESLWRKILEISPQDRIALLYLQRIAKFRIAPPPADWGGTMSLEKM
jgi:hypothetical protein